MCVRRWGVLESDSGPSVQANRPLNPTTIQECGEDSKSHHMSFDETD